MNRSVKKLLMRLILMGAVGVFGIVALTVLSRAMAGITRSEETAAIFNVSAKLPHDLVGAVEWLPDAESNPKPLPTLEREAMTEAWLRGWAQISILSDGSGPVGSSVDGENTDGLTEYYSGPAYDALLGGAPGWLGRPVHQIGHDLQLTFYADDGSLATVSSRSTRLLRSQPFGDEVQWYDAEETWDTVFVLEDGAWRMHHWVRTSAGGQWWSEPPAVPLAAFGPSELRAIDYETKGQTEEEFWTELDVDATIEDLRLVGELGFNAIRLDLPFEVLGGRDMEPEDLQTASDILDIADSYELDVIIGLLEGRTEHQPLHWDADDDHIRTVLETIGDHPAIVLWDLKEAPDLDIGTDDLTPDLLHAWLAHLARTFKSIAPGEPLTIGWSSMRAAAEAPPIGDVVSIHWSPSPTFADELLEVRATSGDRPILIADAEYHTTIGILPGGQTEPEQARYFADLLVAVEEHELDGFTVSTLSDFDIEPVAARMQELAEFEDAEEIRKSEERAALYPTTPTPEPKETGPEAHETPIVAEVEWPTGADATRGLLYLDGTPKPAAAVFAPGADLDAVPVPGLSATIRKPFNIILLFLASAVVGGWGFLWLWDRDKLPIPNALRRKPERKGMITGPVIRLALFVPKLVLAFVLRLARRFSVFRQVEALVKVRVRPLVQHPIAQQLPLPKQLIVWTDSQSMDQHQQPAPMATAEPAAAPTDKPGFVSSMLQRLLKAAEDEPAAVAPVAVTPQQVAQQQLAQPMAQPQVVQPQVVQPQLAQAQIAQPQAAEQQPAQAQIAQPQIVQAQVAQPQSGQAHVGQQPGTVMYDPAAVAPAAMVQQVAIDPMTGQPATAHQIMIDPATGQPVHVAPQAVQPTPGVAEPQPVMVDPTTGQPVQFAAQPAPAVQPAPTAQPVPVPQPASPFAARQHPGGGFHQHAPLPHQQFPVPEAPTETDMRSVSIDFEAIEAALATDTSGAFASFGADRHLPFVIRAASITAQRYPAALKGGVDNGRLHILIRTGADDEATERRIEDHINSPIRTIAAQLAQPSPQTTGMYSGEHLMIVSIDHDGPGDRLHATPGSFPVAFTLAGVDQRPAVSTDLRGCVALSMHQMGSVGLAWGRALEPHLRDVFASELQQQLEYRNWAAEL